MFEETDSVFTSKLVPSNISYKSFKTLPMQNSYCDHRNFDSVKPAFSLGISWVLILLCTIGMTLILSQVFTIYLTLTSFGEVEITGINLYHLVAIQLWEYAISLTFKYIKPWIEVNHGQVLYRYSFSHSDNFQSASFCNQVDNGD
jgi:hypothetical protein